MKTFFERDKLPEITQKANDRPDSFISIKEIKDSKFRVNNPSQKLQAQTSFLKNSTRYLRMEITPTLHKLIPKTED